MDMTHMNVAQVEIDNANRENVEKHPLTKRQIANAGLKVLRDGNRIRGENIRFVYECEIGGVYSPRSTASSEEPKRLIDITHVGGKWRAVIGPAKENGSARQRVMNLASFFSIYVPSVRKAPITPPRLPKSSKPEEEKTIGHDEFRRVLNARVEGEIDRILNMIALQSMNLNRIEKKLDAIIRDLGIKVAE